MGALCGQQQQQQRQQRQQRQHIQLLERQTSRSIENYIKDYEKQERREKKLLLLGTTSSGKSTLFKELRLIDGHRFQEREKLKCKQIIRQNVVSAMIALLQKSLTLYEGNPTTFARCRIDIENEEIAKHVQTIFDFSQETFSNDKMLDEIVLEKLGTAIEYLWKLNPVKYTFDQKQRHFPFPDNLDYFFSKIKEIMTYDYMPDNDDILRTRNDSNGIEEMIFERNNRILRICDIGGQRHDRIKWVFQMFTNVDAIIYVAALNHYECVLFEDEARNSMHEALQLFEEVCNSRWFLTAEIILFLNKDDLFRECIGSGHSLSICFNRERANWQGEQWQNNLDYSPKPGLPYTEDPLFTTSYTAALDFITRQFFRMNPVRDRQIFKHVTCATDTEQIDKVVDDVQNIVIRSNLKKGGLI